MVLCSFPCTQSNLIVNSEHYFKRIIQKEGVTFLVYIICFTLIPAVQLIPHAMASRRFGL